MAERNYVLGRGKVYFARFASGEIPGAFRYVGNTPEVNLTVETEQLDHIDQGSGVNKVDVSVPLSVTRSGTMVMDDIQPDNLALFFLGSVAEQTIVAAASQEEDIDDVAPDQVHVIGLSASNRVGLRNLTGVTVTDQAASPSVTYVEGTDYSIDLVNGQITFLDSVLIGATLAPDVRVNYGVTAGTYTRIISGSTPVEGAMRFIESNADGENNQWIFPKISVTPNGDLALKGDDFRTVPFNLAVLEPSSGEAIYINGQPA